MHTNVILTNKRRIHTHVTQPNYTNTKLKVKAWFRRLLRHPARKRSVSTLNRHTPTHTSERPNPWQNVQLTAAKPSVLCCHLASTNEELGDNNDDDDETIVILSAGYHMHAGPIPQV